MILQDDVLLNSQSDLPFKEYGCALFDIQYLAVMHGTNTFKREHFIMECDNWIRSLVLLEDLTVQNWDRLCQDSGLPYRLVIENKTHKLPESRKLQEGELQLLYLFNPATELHHFVIGDKYDHIVYDSLGESVTGAAYREGTAYIESRRVFRKLA